MAKWYGSNREVIWAFAADPFDERGGRNSQGNVYFNGDGILYSYGNHFPLAVALKKHEDFFLVNGDDTTSTTNKHRSYVFSSLRDYETGTERYAVVPFSSLARAMGQGTRWSSSAYYTARNTRDRLEVIHHKEDYWVDKQVWVTDKETGEKELKDVREHFLGATLIKIDEDYFLSGIDESGRGRGLYFLTKLPRPASSVDDAYLAIRPKGLNGEAHVRQGEFFLVPQDMKKPRGIPVEKKMRLENRGRDEREWRHVATEGFALDGIQYVRGTVRHPEHKMISLGKTWHRVYEAAGAGPDGAIVSWSAFGGFD